MIQCLYKIPLQEFQRKNSCSTMLRYRKYIMNGFSLFKNKKYNCNLIY